MHVKGLLEMMFEVLSDWIEAFITTMESLEAAEGMHTPPHSGAATSGGNTPPSSATASPRGAHHTHTLSGDSQLP